MSRSALEREEQQAQVMRAVAQAQAAMHHQQMQYPGMMHPGMHPGMMHPGMQPGMMQPGMMQPGMMHPGMQPGMQPGVNPAMYNPAMGYYQQPMPGAMVPEEDREKKKNEIPLNNSNNFGINSLLYSRILENDYYLACAELTQFHEVVDEIYNRVTHVEPWSAGTERLPSTAWCLLVKFLEQRLTIKQMHSLLTHKDSPYIRAIGFLYLRVATEPKKLWTWIENYIDDPEEFAPGADPSIKMTMGKYCMKILTDMNYYNTMLPRIPVPIERQIKAYLILFEDEMRRAEANLRLMSHVRPGMQVKAIYKDEENDPAWYEAEVNEVLAPEEKGRKPQIVVTFRDYGNQECCRLGQVDFLIEDERAPSDSRGRDGRRRSRSREHKRSRSRDRHRDDSRDRRRGGSRDRRSGRSPPKDSGSLLSTVMAEVTKRDQERSAAHGKDYAQRPASYKGSLSLKLDRFTHRKKSRSRSPDRMPMRRRGSSRRERSPSPPPRRSRPVDDSKAKYLKSRYGDASAN